MKIFTICIAALLVTFAGVSNSEAQMLDFNVTTAGPVDVGGTVHWTITVTASGAETDGIESVATNLFDTGGNTLSSGTAGGGDFSSYNVTSGGLTTGDPSLIDEIGAFNFTASNARGVDGDLGPLVVATGSFTANNAAGTYDLELTAGSLNSYFLLGGGGTSDYETTFNAGSYTVNAVPEPGSLALFSVALLGFARRRRG